MNDFTKEELQILAEYLDYPIEEIVGSEGNRLQLVLKIQSMIDNYMEHRHEWARIHTNPNIHDWGDETYWKCMTCGVKRE